jgi:hypothetical protein
MSDDTAVVSRRATMFMIITCIEISITVASYDNGYAVEISNDKLIDFNESKVVVRPIVEEDIPSCTYQEVQLTELLVKRISQDHLAVKQIMPGSPVLIQTKIVDNCNDVKDYPITIFFEVRDSDGITNFVAWQQTSLNPGQKAITSTTWTAPDKAGDYSIRSFAIHCITCSGFEGKVFTRHVTVTQNE